MDDSQNKLMNSKSLVKYDCFVNSVYVKSRAIVSFLI